MVDYIVQLLGNLPLWLKIIILATLPVAELRVAIPLAIAWGVSAPEAFLLGVVGNMIPVLPLLLLLKPLAELAGRWRVFGLLLDRVFARTRRHGDTVQKYGALGLALFVGVPLPGTGAWSGTVLAFLFGIKNRYAFPSIAIGVILAGVAVTLASSGVAWLFRIFDVWAVSGIVVLLVVIGILIYRQRKKR